MIKGGCSVKVLGSDGKKALWERGDYHVVHEGTENDEIGLRRFDFYLFDKDGGG